MSRPRRGTALWITGLLLCVLVAGIGSWYASSSPDGLERAALDAGFASTARDSATASSPLADYTVGGRQERLPVGIAGVVGVAVTLLLAGGLTVLVRRRARTSAVPAPRAGDAGSAAVSD